MVRLCPQTVDYLCDAFTSLDTPYAEGSRPRREPILSRVVPLLFLDPQDVGVGRAHGAGDVHRLWPVR